jgi:regulatory protein
MRRTSPRKFASDDALYEYALKALMRRAHSVYEMRRALEQRAEDESLVKPVLQKLKERNYLDDGRFARQFARQQAVNRRRGRHRITQELRKRGVPDRHIDAALEEVFSEVDESAAVRKRIERKLKTLRGPLDERKRAALYASLLRAGFDADTIRRELRALIRGEFELPEFEPSESTDAREQKCGFIVSFSQRSGEPTSSSGREERTSACYNSSLRFLSLKGRN